MFTTGTADGHIDLLEKVRKYLVEEVGWTELSYDGSISPSPDDDLDTVRLSLRAPGALTGHEYFLNIQTMSRTSDGSYGWRINCAFDYDASLTDSTQLMASPYAFFNTWQNTIDYWIYASGRRFILVAKCNTSYISMYAGLFQPFALPSEYLKPFAIIGNSDRLEPYNVNNSGNQFIINPGTNAAWIMNLNGDDWFGLRNTQRRDATDLWIGDGVADAICWPMRSIMQWGNNNQYQESDWNHHGFLRFRPNLQGESPQFLTHLMSAPDFHIMGVLEGVYTTAGFGRTSEQVLEMNDRNYRVFQNIFRTTPRDFMSIEEY